MYSKHNAVVLDNLDNLVDFTVDFKNIFYFLNTRYFLLDSGNI